MEDFMKKTISIITVSVLLMGIIYFAGVGFYAEKFSANTVFGTVDISNLTLEEAQNRLEAELNEKEFVLKENGAEVARVNVSDLNPEYHATNQLLASYHSQDPSTWVNNIFQTNEFQSEYSGLVDFDEEALAQELQTQGLTNEEREAAIDAAINYNDTEGYYVKDGEEGTQIDLNRLSEEIVEGLQQENYTIDLEDAYALPEVLAEDEEIESFLTEIEEVSSVAITYEIVGEQITIPQAEIEKWIYFDANNEIVIDPVSVEAYLNDLNEEYSTFNKTRTFQSTLQGEVTVPPGILGWGIDTEAETEALISDLHAGSDVSREPVYYSSGGIEGAADDIGRSYVEIDLSYQAMYLYVDGQLILETPIVSGQIGAETVPGANAVNEMLTNTNLVGFNQFSNVRYSTPVNYWIRFDDQAQGIHDASWQGSFGGNVYQYAGSLGCINTPLDAVSTIYNNVNYGTPVIVFY